jgi:hypothetical protein
MSRKKKQENEVKNCEVVNASPDVIQSTVKVNKVLCNILEDIAITSYNDFHRVGETITKNLEIDRYKENMKNQHGTLAVKSILARSNLINTNRNFES